MNPNPLGPYSLLSTGVLAWKMFGASLPYRTMFMIAMTDARDFFSLPVNDRFWSVSMAYVVSPGTPFS